MNKKQVLIEKIRNLLYEVEKAKNIVDEDKFIYLDNYAKSIERIMNKVEEESLPPSQGGVMGTMRGISEYDSLASIKSLYDAACDVDLYYSNECKTWK